MGPFDKVIGYRRVVSELERIASVLVDPSPYERLGARVPNGLLIAGEPGLGKTLMARCFVEAAGCPCVTLRRTVAGNEFLDQIRDAFVRAAEEAPSIIFLDDLDKFGSGDRNRASEPEYVAVQSCIDDYAGKGVFVLATANNVLRAVPPSLVRAGRFDRTIYLERPEYEDARLIAAHYLREHSIPNTIDPDVVAQFPMSCAELEARVNAAAVVAASEGSDVVTTEHVVRVCVEHWEGRAWRPCKEPMGWQAAAKTKRYCDRARCACHEAGHAVQYDKGYVPGRIRTALVPVVNLASNVWMIVLIVGISMSFAGLVDLAIILFAASVLFQLVTLPVEFDASRRALAYLRTAGFDGEVVAGARKVLTAAALTYVAAALVSCLQLLYLLGVSNRRD